jgi:hypothetical protein
MSQNDVLMIYQGVFDQQIVKSVISMTEKKLETDHVAEATRKKMFNVMVESLQNICKHQLIVNGLTESPFLIIGKNDNTLNIVTGNLIPAIRKSEIEQKIDFVNAMNKDELKDYYKKARLNSVISSVGGAGLGFIDMARKTGNKLDYRFYPVTEDYTYFILNNKINAN